jgi:hypothetical protein
MQCARHPNVETELTCGRCETPICPRCAVFTDVGARCPTCAPARKLPQFEVGPLYLLRGAAAALAAGAGLGAVWGVLIPGSVFFFALLLVGALVGYLIAEAVGAATNRKSGTPLQVVAASGVIAAYLVRNLVAGNELLPADDLFGYIAVIVAGAVAISRLRY